MGKSARIARFGFGKQTAKGTGLTAPVYQAELLEGKVFGATAEDAVVEAVTSKPLYAGAVRTKVGVALGSTMVAHPAGLGLLLYAALGAIATTGITPNFTHAITPASDVPWLTLFGELAGGWQKIVDAKVDTLSLRQDDPGLLRVAVAFGGLSPSLLEATWAATNDEAGTVKFIGAGGYVKLDTITGTPAVVPERGVDISIARKLQPVQPAMAVTASDLVPGVAEVETTVKIAPDSLAEYRKVFTGSASGTTPALVPAYGSLEYWWTIDANTELKIAAGRVLWECPDFPDVDASGALVELTLKGKVLQPASGDGLTATLKNQTPSY